MKQKLVRSPKKNTRKRATFTHKLPVLPDRFRLALLCVILWLCIGFQGCTKYVLETTPGEAPAAVGAPGYADEAIPAWDETYKDEPVVWLLSETRVDLKEDYSYSEESHIVLKIQKEGGKTAGSIPLPYNRTTDVIDYIHAATITPDGNRVACTRIEDLEAYQTQAASGEDRIKLLTMPQVAAGSLLEVSVKVTHTKPILQNHFFQIVPITSAKPVKISRFTLAAPAGMALRFKKQHTDIEPVVNVSGTIKTYMWEAKGKEKIISEDDMPDVGELCEAVFISSLTGWGELADIGFGLFKKNMDVSPEMKAKVSEIVALYPSEKERVQAIVEYVRNGCRYVSMSMDSRHYEPRPASEVFAAKYGDGKDLTVLSIALLQEIGVTAYPAFFAFTLDPEFETRLPMPAYFNHAILCIEYKGKTHFTDIVRDGFYFDELAYDIANGRVLILNGAGGKLTRIPSADPDLFKNASEFTVRIDKDGSAVFDGYVTFPRMVSTTLRGEYLTVTPEAREKWLSSLDASFCKDGVMMDRKLDFLVDPYKNIRIDVKYKRPVYVKTATGGMLIGPGQISTPTLAASERKYPIVFVGHSRQENSTQYILPKGVALATLPEDIHYDTEFIKFDRTYQAKGSTITTKDVFEIKTVRMPADSYPAIQAFMNTLSQATGDMIVIQKKGR